jgi:hypothetical protein
MLTKLNLNAYKVAKRLKKNKCSTWNKKAGPYGAGLSFGHHSRGGRLVC